MSIEEIGVNIKQKSLELYSSCGEHVNRDAFMDYKKFKEGGPDVLVESMLAVMGMSHGLAGILLGHGSPESLRVYARLMKACSNLTEHIAKLETVEPAMGTTEPSILAFRRLCDTLKEAQEFLNDEATAFMNKHFGGRLPPGIN